MDRSNEGTAHTTHALAQRIASRWQGTSSGTGPTLTVVNTTSMVQRIQRSVSRAGLIQPRVEQLPVVSMDHYATRHVARFPEPTAHFKPRAMTLPDAPVLPLVGEPTTAEPPPETPAPAISGEIAAPAAPDEEPEWLKRLPSFEEATAQLRFPDSVDVKLPERTQRQPPTRPPAEPPTTVRRAEQPPVIARKPQPPETPKGPRRMRVMTQVEEFTPGRQPPPVSLSDLRRVRVGEPQPSKKPDDTEREPAPAEDEPPTLQRAPTETAETPAPEPSKSPPVPASFRDTVSEGDEIRRDDTIESPGTAEEGAVRSAQRPIPTKKGRPPVIQRTPADATAPEPPKPRVTTEEPDVEPLAPEVEAEPPPAEHEAPELQRAPTEVSPEPLAPTTARETQEAEEAPTLPTDTPARRPAASRHDKPPTIQRTPTETVEPTPTTPPDTRAAPVREEADTPSVAAPLRQDSVPESEDPSPSQPPTEAPSAREEEPPVSRPPERPVAREAQAEKSADASPKTESTPAALQRAPAKPEVQAPNRERSKPAPPPAETLSTTESKPPALQREPAEAAAPETQRATERTAEKPRADTVRAPISTEGGEPPKIQRAPADVTEPELPADTGAPSANVPGSDEPTPVAEEEPPLMQRKPTKTPVVERRQQPSPTKKEESAPGGESRPVTTETGKPPAIQRTATETPAPELPKEPPADAPTPQVPVSEGDEARRDETAGTPVTTERRAQAEESEPPAIQRAATEAAAPEPAGPPAGVPAPQAPVFESDEARQDEAAGRPPIPERRAQVGEDAPVTTEVGEPPEIQRVPKEAAAPELPAPPTRPAPSQPPSLEVEEALSITEDGGEPPVLRRAPADVSAPEPAKSPARPASLPASSPEGDEAPSRVEGEPAAVQRPSAEPPAPENEPSTSSALQRTPAEAPTPELPAPPAASPPRDEVQRVGSPEEPTTVEEDPVEGDQSPSLIKKAAPVARENLKVDTGLVQRLTARAEVAVQRTPERAPVDAPVVQAPAPSTPETTIGEQLSPPAEALAADAYSIPPARTPATPPAPVARSPLPPQDVDAPPRAPDRRPRGSVPIELPLAPRTAVVQRTALHAETKVAETPEQWSAPEATVDVQTRAPMTSMPTYVQRASAGEAMTETRTLEEWSEAPVEPLELLDESELAQLARDILPIVKRLLQMELERQIQSDLEW